MLPQLVEELAMQLEGEADEETREGKRFTQWRERLLDSQNEKGTMWKDQCSRVYKALIDMTR